MPPGEEVQTAAELCRCFLGSADMQCVFFSGKDQPRNIAGVVVVCQNLIGVCDAGFIQPGFLIELQQDFVAKSLKNDCFLQNITQCIG